MRPGDVIFIEANSGAVKRVGRSDAYAAEVDLEAEEYVPLPKAAYEGNIKHANVKKIGTVFGGKNEIGITVEEILKREAKM